MEDEQKVPTPLSARIDHIPVVWFEPASAAETRRLVILLTNLGGTVEDYLPLLWTIAESGAVALSFDLWQHGERGTEEPTALRDRVESDFRRHMWPILGQTTLDAVRVIDWAIGTLGVDPRVSMVGGSAGGCVSVAAAEIDSRIARVGAVVATPDRLFPGIHEYRRPEVLLPPGTPDGYAQLFYELLNPMTHIERYAGGPAIEFYCGEKDTRVPADAALRFKAALEGPTYPAAGKVNVTILPGVGHQDADPELFWKDCLAFLTAT